MRVYVDIETSEELARYLQENSWSGARDRISSLDYETLLQKCDVLMDYFDECSETELNDEIWFGSLFNEEEEEEEEEDEDEEEEEEEDK